MRYLSLCSGIEAASVAWHDFGWTPVAFSEVEPFCCAVLEARWPGVPNLGDMTKIKESDIEPVELLVGGTPCQSFSRAGLQGGLQDPRGNLALRFMQIASVARPKWVIWENVPGAMQTNGGRDFGAILGALADLGYGVAYRILDAADFVPQRRRRVFVVGCLGDWDAPARVLCRTEGGGGDSQAALGEGPVDSEGRASDRGPGGGEWWDGSPVTQTLDAVLYKKQCLPEKNRFPAVLVPAWVKCQCCENYICQIHGCHAHDCPCGAIEEWDEVGADPYSPCLLRYITPLECERLMGFPDDYTNITYRKKPAADGPRYKALGNSMAVPCMHWLGLRIGQAFNTLPGKEPEGDA